MKKTVSNSIYIGLIFFNCFSLLHAQGPQIDPADESTWLKVQNTGNTEVYTTHHGTDGYTPLDSYEVDFSGMWGKNWSNEEDNWGIYGKAADGYSEGTIKITMYQYDEDEPDNIGRIFFGMQATVNEAKYYKEAFNVNLPYANNPFVGEYPFQSNDMKGLVAYWPGKRVIQDDDGTLCERWKNIPPVGYFSFSDNTYWYTQDFCESRWDPIQKVVIKVELTNAYLIYFDIPLVTDYRSPLLGSFFKKQGANVKIRINEEDPVTITGSVHAPLTTLNAQMGDKISLEVHGFSETEKPVLEGIPQTWIARFAGELMYYCTPSVNPGDLTPFIGFDSRIHNLMVRKYPQGFEERVPDWEWDEEGKYWKWSFTVQRRMDGNLAKYPTPFLWPKYHLVNNKKQRRNQKEGVNIQYLNYFKRSPSGVNSHYQQYDGNVKYMLGYDDDELGYFDVQPDKTSNPLQLSTTKPIVKLENLPWKEMPEGDSVQLDPTTNYPYKGAALNEMVSAYQLYKAGSYYEKIEPYEGYEIHDNNTNVQHPNGDATGNIKHPGKNISVKNGATVVRFALNVTAPLTTDHGFYGAIEGTTWPAYGEQNVPYTLTGLQGRDDLDNFTLKYEWMDRLGNLDFVERSLTDLSAAEKSRIFSSGDWTEFFDMEKPAYSSITAYYQRPGGEQVMIAGKELKPIFILMAGVKSLRSPNNTAITSGSSAVTQFTQGFKEGDGHGARIWQEDYRDVSKGDYTQAHTFGNKIRYSKPYIREYVFRVGDVVEFTAFDGDPHLWENDDTEYYLGSRTLAKRTPKDYLDGTNVESGGAYLKYYLGNQELITNRVDRRVTHTFNQVGEYLLKVSYRGTSEITHKIKVVDWNHDQRSLIAIKPLSADEANWLGVSEQDRNYYKTARVTHMLSNYAYQEGFRAFNGESVDNNGVNPRTNRWANFNDYADEYLWQLNATGNRENTHNHLPGQINDILEQPNAKVKDYLDNYFDNVFKQWFIWKDFGFHYSSNWLRMPSSDGLQTFPPFVATTDVIRINEKGLELDPLNTVIQYNMFSPRQPTSPWQFVVPLLSYTQYQGFRSRTNPSCVYDLAYLFNDEHGAFSGKPILPSDPNKVQSPDYEDDYKDQQEFYLALKGNKLLVFDTRVDDIVEGDQVKAFNTNPRELEKTHSNSRAISQWTVIPADRLSTPTAYIPNEDTQMDLEQQQEFNEGALGRQTIIYPNPSLGIFQIYSGNTLGNIKNITVINFLGTNVFFQSFNKFKKQYTLNLKGIPNGVYMVKISGETGQEIKKIIKQFYENNW